MSPVTPAHADSRPPFWRSARRELLFIGVALGISLAVILHILQLAFGASEGGDAGGLFKGDFPAFYGAGVIVARGEGGALFDLDRQAAVQDEFWPSDVGAYSAFAYPPFFAALHAPLAAFSPSAAKAIYSALMLVFLALAVHTAAFFIPAYRGKEWRAVIFHLACLPLLSGVFGGQNVGLSMLLCALGIKHLLQDQDLRSGVAFGAWLFKPQFALPMILVSCLCGRWRVLLGAAFPGALYYLLGAWVNGVFWPRDYLRAVAHFSALDSEVNGFQMISILEACKSIGRYLETPPPFSLLGAILVVFVVGALFVRCLQVRRGKTRNELSLEERSQHFRGLRDALLLSTVGALLISPHTLYYDLGIAIPAVITLFRLSTDRGVNALIVTTLLVGLMIVLRYQFIFQPLTIFLLGAFLLLLRHGRREGSGIAAL